MGGDPRCWQWELREADRDDADLLFELYASTRTDLAALSLPGPARAALLELQYRAMTAGYAARFPDAEHRLVVVDGEAVGRVLLAQEPGALRLVDVTLLPDHRGAGLGADVVRDVLERAGAAGLAVRLEVAVGNPARRLYERLGFQSTGTGEVYESMQWTGP